MSPEDKRIEPTNAIGLTKVLPTTTVDQETTGGEYQSKLDYIAIERDSAH